MFVLVFIVKIFACEFCLGMESPQAVQKILSLVQNSRTKQQSGNVISPAQSPLMLPRAVRPRNASAAVQRVPSINYRSGSNSAEIQPVELNPESSSVTNLYSTAVRISSTGDFRNIFCTIGFRDPNFVLPSLSLVSLHCRLLRFTLRFAV